ncbi:hypothetical protein HDU76_008715 [Blyttiomyces sp. JEL0837]|nr:hypothetical protein HDU76_008715 [Blyttiomyces sp. JEL0837]
MLSSQDTIRLFRIPFTAKWITEVIRLLGPHYAQLSDNKTLRDPASISNKNITSTTYPQTPSTLGIIGFMQGPLARMVKAQQEQKQHSEGDLDAHVVQHLYMIVASSSHESEGLPFDDEDSMMAKLESGDEQVWNSLMKSFIGCHFIMLDEYEVMSSFWIDHANIENRVKSSMPPVDDVQSSQDQWTGDIVKMVLKNSDTFMKTVGGKYVLLASLHERYVPFVNEVTENPIILEKYVKGKEDGAEFQSPPGTFYYQLVCPDHVVLQSREIGETWVDERTGEQYIMEVLSIEDAEWLKKESTFHYDEDYLQFILSAHPNHKFSRVIRTFPDREPVSWCLLHGNFTLAMVFTIPSYRRKGLSTICVGTSCVAFRNWCREEYSRDGTFEGVNVVLPNCMIDVNNAASLRMFEGIGFKRIDGDYALWCPMGSLKEVVI